MYFITVSEGILQDNHEQRIENAIWLYLDLLNRITKIKEDGTGIVSGGMPLKTKDLCKKRSLRNTKRYIDTLRKEKYITTKRTSYGLIFSILKAKKMFGLQTKRSDRYGTSHGIRSAISVTAEVPNLVPRSARYGTNIVDSSKDINKRHIYMAKNLSIIDNVTPLLTWGESRRGRKYAQPIKQRKHIESMLKVGWTPQEIQEKYEFLEEDKYWGDRGIDFAIVSSQLDKEKTKQGESLLWDN